MKKSQLLLLASLLLALVAFLVCYRLALAPHDVGTADDPGAEMAWLKREFNLTDAEFAQVKALHDAYQPRCRENCRMVDESNARLKKLLADGSDVLPELEAAFNDAARVRVHCQVEMVRHFQHVSRAMSPEQGKRYLDWVCEQALMPSSNGMMCPAPAPLMRHGN